LNRGSVYGSGFEKQIAANIIINYLLCTKQKEEQQPMRNLTPANWLLAVALLIAVVGCTTNSPVESVNSVPTVSQAPDILAGPPDNQVQFTAHVATIDADQRLLTFDEVAHIVFVPEGCPIVQVQAGVETPLEFADLQVGDWVKVCGLLQEDGNIDANKIVVCAGGVCDGFDLIFQDSIATIDYGAGSFTVYGRTETLLIDENTVIWGTIPYQHSAGPGDEKDGTPTTLTDADDGRHGHAVDTIFSFTDLQPGYIVVIKADIVDEATLRVISIKVVTSTFKQSILFQDYLASVDCENREITFETETWIGSVCSGAALLNGDGDPLTLDDFASGDYTAVKGVALTEDTLRICEMIKL